MMETQNRGLNGPKKRTATRVPAGEIRWLLIAVQRHRPIYRRRREETVGAPSMQHM